MKTKLLKQKILDLAIQGKLVPQDPNDEPASVLLERIKAEKERLIAEGKIKRPKKSVQSCDKSHYENVPFEIPDSWEWTKLCDITELIEDCPHSTAKNEGIGYALIRTPNVGEGHLILEGVHRVSKTVYDNRNARAIPRCSDIIYAREAPAGNAAVIGAEEPVCLGQRTVLIRPVQKYVNSKLLAYFILSPLSRNRLVSTAVGSTAAHVNLASIRPFYIPIPPLAEQERIVNAIEEWQSLINILEKEKDNLQKAVNWTKSKILDLAIRGKLVPQDPNDEPASELLKRIAPNAKPCDTSHYANLPNSWVMCKLKDIAKVTNGKNQSKVINANGKYPIYGSGGVIGYADDFLCEGNSTIIGRKGTINNPILVTTKFWNVDTAFGMTPNDGIDFKYFFYFCKNYDFRQLDKSTTLPSLTKSNIELIEIPLPPENEQRRIVDMIEKVFTYINRIMTEL